MRNGILLLYPPVGVHEFPHMAIPHLKGYLKEKGIYDVVSRDYNVDIMNQIIYSRFNRIAAYFEDRGINISEEEIKKNFLKAKKILRDNKDQKKDEWAFSILNIYLKIAGSNISEVCFSPLSFDDIAHRYRSTIQDYVTQYIQNIISQEISEIAPRIIGISIAMGSQLYYALFMGREIKKRFPNIKIVLGGPQISLFWKQIIEYGCFRDAYDHMIHGEGEEGIYQYIQFVDGKIKIQDVPGLIWNKESGENIVNESLIIKNPDELPLPVFDDYDLDAYVYPKLPYMMTKGCYWAKCAFCSYRNEYPYIKKTAARIVEEIELLRNKYNIRLFHFIDDAIPPSLLMEFSQLVIEKKLNIKYESYLRLDPAFSLPVCQMLAESGLRSALFGLESACERVLGLMNKGIQLETAICVLKNMKQAGIKAVVSCIIGFPTETREEAMETIAFIKDHQEDISQAFLVHYGLISDMKDHMEQFGIQELCMKNPVRYDDAGFVAFGYSYKTKRGMSVEESLALVHTARKQIESRVFPDTFFS